MRFSSGLPSTAVRNPRFAAILSQGRRRIPGETSACRKEDCHQWMGQNLESESKVRQSMMGWRTNSRTQSQEMGHWGAHCRLRSSQGPNPSDGGVHTLSVMSALHQEQLGKCTPTRLWVDFPPLSPSLERVEERNLHWLDWMWGCRWPFPAKRHFNSDLLKVPLFLPPVLRVYSVQSLLFLPLGRCWPPYVVSDYLGLVSLLLLRNSFPFLFHHPT